MIQVIVISCDFLYQSRLGDGWTQECTEDPVFDKFGFVRNKGGCKFEFTVNGSLDGPARSWSLFKIAGTQGLLNDVYVLTNDLYNDKPLFRKDGDTDTWFKFTKDKNWCFSNTKRKDTNDTSYLYESHCIRVKKGIDHPALVNSWKIRSEDVAWKIWKQDASMEFTLLEV